MKLLIKFEINGAVDSVMNKRGEDGLFLCIFVVVFDYYYYL
jgi:hypothetical protein